MMSSPDSRLVRRLTVPAMILRRKVLKVGIPRCRRALFSTALMLGSLPAAAEQPIPIVESFSSSGKRIEVERSAPADSARHPAIIILYGASGLTARPDWMRHYARDLAAHSYVAFLLHYFDATDSATAGELPVPAARFRVWAKTVEDAITYASRDRNVDSHRIGVLGISLGAFLALWEGSQDPRVKAIVEYYGGVSMFLGPAKRMPPTLILHGEKDSFVPVSEAYRVQRLLEKYGAAREIKIYPGLEHGFDGSDGNEAATQDAWNRTSAFFHKHLGTK